MSDLEGKLEKPARGMPGKARAKLEQLQKRRGFKFLDADSVTVSGMETEELWLRISGRGQESIFEMQGSGGGTANGSSADN